jgi:hypothetical protein
MAPAARVLLPPMKRMEGLLRAADRWQQRHRWLSSSVAAWKKFGDDQAGHLAALIAYYAFASEGPSASSPGPGGTQTYNP